MTSKNTKEEKEEEEFLSSSSTNEKKRKADDDLSTIKSNSILNKAKRFRKVLEHSKLLLLSIISFFK